MKVNTKDILMVKLLIALKHIDPKLERKKKCDRSCLNCMHPVHIRTVNCKNCGFKMRK